MFSLTSKMYCPFSKLTTSIKLLGFVLDDATILSVTVRTHGWQTGLISVVNMMERWTR